MSALINEASHLPYNITTLEDFEKILHSALEYECSDVHIDCGLDIKVRVHGKLAALYPFAPRASDCERILSVTYKSESAVAKVSGGGEIDYAYELRKPFNEEFIRWRVAAYRVSRNGVTSISLVFRKLNSVPVELDQLKVPSEITDVALKIRTGLIVVAGETGSGKSTLLASILRRRQETISEKLITLESPIEYVYDEVETQGIVQQRLVSDEMSEMATGGDTASFTSGLVSAMRQDPDVILVGESRSVKTIEAAILGASTGHVLFTTVHAGSVAKIINRMVRSFDSADRDRAQTDLVESLSLLVFQKLVSSTDGKRTAIREYLIMDAECRDILRQSSNLVLDSFKVLFKSGYPLIKDIESKYKAGIISEDVYKKERIEYLSQISHLKDKLTDELSIFGA